MEFIKKNWVSLTCALVALIAVILMPTFIRSQQKDLQTKLDARAATYRTLDQLKTKPRHQPVVSTDPNASSPDLTVFPGPDVIKAGEDAITNVQEQSRKIEDLATKMNVHSLLVPGSLPVPSDTYRFQEAYLAQLQTEIPKELNSVTPPTDAEIATRQAELEKQMTREAPHNQVTGEIYNQDALDQKIARMKETLPQDMRQEAATRHKMYMAAATALSVSPDLSAGSGGATQLIDAEKVWLAQMSLWVQQDVVKAIVDLNAKSNKVADSIVKQLVLIEMPSDRDMYAIPGAANNGAPAGLISSIPSNTDTDPLPKDYSVSPTGRYCNGVFDVVHFTVCITVDAGNIDRVIDALQRGRLLTVYQTDVEAVNSAQEQRDGYYFGMRPVVTLTLKCEELFLRNWTRQYMPESVRKFLNVRETAPGESTAMAG